MKPLLQDSVGVSHTMIIEYLKKAEMNCHCKQIDPPNHALPNEKVSVNDTGVHLIGHYFVQ
jgi:hypothetical protein